MKATPKRAAEKIQKGEAQLDQAEDLEMVNEGTSWKTQKSK